MSYILNTKMCALLRFECDDVHAIMVKASMLHLHSVLTYLLLSFVIHAIQKPNGRNNVSIQDSIRSQMCMLMVCTREKEREHVRLSDRLNELNRLNAFDYKRTGIYYYMQEEIKCVAGWKNQADLIS